METASERTAGVYFFVSHKQQTDAEPGSDSREPQQILCRSTNVISRMIKTLLFLIWQSIFMSVPCAILRVLLLIYGQLQKGLGLGRRRRSEEGKRRC